MASARRHRLDPDEERTWTVLSYLLVQLPGALDAAVQRTSGLNRFEYQVMATLSIAPQRSARLSKVAEFTGSSLSRLSYVVSSLECRGWLLRTPDPDDGRYTLGTLTEEGLKQVVAATPGYLAEVRRLIFDQLTKTQQQQLERIALRILHAIEPDRAPITERVPALPEHLRGPAARPPT